jgi:Flp pilus assembly protein TadG
MRRRGRSRRGQSLIEVALVLPILLLVTLGGTDLAQAYRFNSDVAGASRAGMRSGIQSDGNDIGDAIRSEPNVVVSNDTPTWGATAQGGNNANCGQAGATGVSCGDLNGCPPSAFTGTRIACFAVRSCVINSSEQCTTYSSWGLRPEPNQSYGTGLEVVVVYKFTPVTPLIASFGSGGSFYLTGRTQGLELYY